MVTSTGNAPEKKISSAFIYFFGSFGGILFGYDIGVMTGALPFLQNDWNLQGNASIIGWITSAVMFGAIFGGALAGQLSDRLGRRKMILISALIFVVGSILSGIAPHNGQYYLIGVRILLGLAVGAASALVPAYMSEMAPAHLRGRLSGINQTMIVSGMLLSYIVDFLLKDLPETMAWRLMLGLAAVPAIILFLGVLRLPESPRFLVNHGFVDQARRVLGYIRKNDKEVEAELADIQNTAASEAQAQSKTTFATLLSDKYRYLVTAGVGVAAFQQFQGSAAASGDMSHLIAISKLIYSCCGISAADDRNCICFSQCCCNCFGSCCEFRHLEASHRSVPYNGFSSFNSISEQFCSFRSDIQTFPAIRNLSGRNNLCICVV